MSDIYAMGGDPKICMNILCAPNCLDEDVLRSILAGGLDKINEAGALLAGGHTIDDKEPKYGLCVSSIMPINHVIRNAGAKPGDILVLTKPLGLGILITAMKADLASTAESDAAISQMLALNKYAKDCARKFSTHACTDITGFGLFGHAYELASASGVSLEISASKLPILRGARNYASMGIIPEGAYKNFEYLRDKIAIDPAVPRDLIDIASDPQTSGGLLIALDERNAQAALAMLCEKCEASIIGHVVERLDHSINYTV